MSNWEDTFTRWSQGPGKVEDEKCERAVDAIRKAIAADTKLNKRNILVFPQGSYRNRTNIRIESDVDVCICCKNPFFPEYPKGTTKESFGNVDGDYPYPEFKNDVEAALVRYFGRQHVTRGNKAFDLKSNTYRVDADAVPTFSHRRYATDRSWIEGVELRPDDGKPSRIINWPEQVYSNGVQKHTNTARRYKKVIRIFKNLRNQMQKDGMRQANDIASFLIECLIWNVPNPSFGNPTLTADVRACLIHLISKTKEDESCLEWREVSELKYLFRPTQPWTRQQAHAFLCACWHYLGFKP
jgi:hypothetical protein